ncbi:hypothetical protein TNCV_4040001 [Trichonephila clavipes]|nr:hypothetical protein TNCV_4040001 [Trichonephila clavipes]
MELSHSDDQDNTQDRSSSGVHTITCTGEGLYLKKRNPAVYFQVDDHVDPGNCPAAVSSEKTRPSSYGVLLSPANKYYKEEEAKELLEVITAKRLEREQQQKLEQQEQLSIEKLRLEIELSRNANQSATQNNGQT